MPKNYTESLREIKFLHKYLINDWYQMTDIGSSKSLGGHAVYGYSTHVRQDLQEFPIWWEEFFLSICRIVLGLYFFLQMRKSQRRGYLCIRSIFGLFNGLFWIIGGGVVGIAIWLRISYNGFVSLLPQHELLSLDSIILISGAVLFAAAFCGCSGAWFMSPCLLISYFILISILCGAELVCGVMGFLYSETLFVLLQQELLTGIQTHYNTSIQYSGITLAWDHIQNQLSCCGVHHYEDWFNISAWPGNLYVPHSCCIPSFQYMDDCGQLEEVSMWFPSGCYNKAQIWFKERLHLVGIVGFVLAFIQIFGLISSMSLFCFTRRRAGFKTYKAVKSQSFAT